jgi:hypothetical protein
MKYWCNQLEKKNNLVDNSAGTADGAIEALNEKKE